MPNDMATNAVIRDLGFLLRYMAIALVTPIKIIDSEPVIMGDKILNNIPMAQPKGMKLTLILTIFAASGWCALMVSRLSKVVSANNARETVIEMLATI